MPLNLLRKIDDGNLLFTADVHRDQHIYAEDPAPYLPKRTSKVGRTPSKLNTGSQSERIDSFFEGMSESQWQEVFVR